MFLIPKNVYICILHNATKGLIELKLSPQIICLTKTLISLISTDRRNKNFLEQKHEFAYCFHSK